MAISTLPPRIAYEVAWNAGPFQVSPPPLFTSIADRVKRPWSTSAGRQYELDRNEAGTWKPGLDNRDGALDPNNAASPFAPNVLPGRQCRVRATLAVNLLTVDQATAGEGSAVPPGPVPARMCVTNDFGYPLTIAASGSAFQGAQVYQAVLPAGATTNATILTITNRGASCPQVPISPGVWYSFQAQAQITSGSTAPCMAAILWYDIDGNPLTPIGGTPATLTAGSGAWTTLSVSAQAPLTAYSAWLKLQINATVANATTFLVDGLQWEASQTPTTWQMPGTLGANMLPREIATGTQAIDTITDTAADWFYPAAGTVTQATNLTAAPSGQTAAAAWTTPAGTGNSTPLYCGAAPAGATAAGPVQDTVQVAAGTQYTASVYLSRVASADVTVQVTVSWRWFDATGALVSTASGAAVTVPTAGWVRGTSTATAPTGAVWGRPRIYISSPAPTTAQNTIYATGWQVEAEGAASTWVDPGTVRAFFTGYIDQLPQRWELSGTWTRSDLLAVDALGGIGSDTLLDPFLEECLALGPDFLYALDDPQGAGMVADAAGQCPPGAVTAAPHGAGSLTLGATISGTTVFTGTQGPVAQFANTPSSANSASATYIALPAQDTVPNWGVNPGAVQPFTRMLAFQASTVPSAPMTLWSVMGGQPLQQPTFLGINIFIDNSGKLNIHIGGGTDRTQTWPTSVCDGNWHLVTVGCDASTELPTFSLDGAATTATGAGSFPYLMVNDSIGAFVLPAFGTYNAGADAQIALAAQFPVNLTQAQITNLYDSWLTASAAESSGERFARILSWIGWTGPTDIDAGSTQDMGGAQDAAGASALDALAGASTTENGDAYASASGVMTFKGRADRYNRNIPVVIFGERADLGEWAYEDVQLPLDQVHTYTDVQVSQYTPFSQYSFYNPQQQVATASSPADERLFFDRVLSRTINVESFSEVQDCADYLLGLYERPVMRAKSIKLHPSAVPGLYAVCLNLAKGSRIRLMRRPNAWAPAIQFDGFVERIQWDVSPTGDAWVTLEASPATRAAFWVLAALHTTLNVQAASGQNQAVINALADSGYNPLAASLPQGYQLTFDPGTPIAETMTLAATGIPATTPGYLTAMLTFTANFQHTHAMGAVVCEPLPMGYTDPTTWDPFSILGAGSAQLQTAAAAGTAQITIGPWPDAGANPAAADLNTGDLLWIGPGGASFEGHNLLHPDVATAGEGAIPLAAGASGAPLGMRSDISTPTVTASTSAFQGTKVWQVPVGPTQTAPAALIYMEKAPAAGFLEFTGSAYVRSATTGADPQIYAYLQFMDRNGAFLAQLQGAAVTLTGSPTAAWTRITVTASAPDGAVWAQLAFTLAAAPTVAWNFQADALQYEQAAAAGTFDVCPQVFSVGQSAPGYASVTITLARNLANSHAVGETVCDPLPPGTASPDALSPTTRLAY